MIVATRTALLILSPLATSYAAILISQSISDVRKFQPAPAFARVIVLSGTPRHAPFFHASLQMT